ncbi:rhodanese-like domain-containing protein [Streptomyces sp. FXJ1.172]|uniref:rhodanese-like domain-containing protein n=1 Tax=Streptomyces sp. FXJ1.172 TaxID=710705 RepID=UPI0007CF8EA8|nr:rhodanese-like domain-containing protein [Streptomyces sp. FXJ1.172]WEO93299.1 rhodanese-like domain-containing protein [Streptomyces sp. FXJ1.172]
MESSPSGTGRITVQEAAERTGHAARDTASGTAGAPVLLDVREPDEWNAGHVPGAVHLSLATLYEGMPLPFEVQGRCLIVICRSGNRSRRAAELLGAHGVEAVDVIGGMRAWAEAGLPVVDARGLRGTVA